MANMAAINKLVSQDNVITTPPPQPTVAATICSAAAAVDEPPSKKPRTQINTPRNKCNAKAAKSVQPCAVKGATTDIGKLFNAVIEKNTRKVSDCVRGSLENMLKEFWSATKPTQQLEQLQQQLNGMRITCAGQVDEVQQKNATLRQEVDTVNAKCTELADILNATKSKMTVMDADLKKSIKE